MPAVIGIVVKGPVFGKLDQRLNRSVDDLRAIREEVQKTDLPLRSLAESFGVTGPDHVDHIDKEVLGSDPGSEPAPWWPQFSPDSKSGEIRAAYLQALDLSIASGDQDGKARKRIKTLWIRGGQDFQMVVVESDAEIQVLWLTPAAPPPTGGGDGSAYDEDIYVIGTEERTQSYYQQMDEAGHRPSRPRRLVEAQKGRPGVYSLRMRG